MLINDLLSSKSSYKYIPQFLDMALVTANMIFAKCWWQQIEYACDEMMLKGIIQGKEGVIPSYSINLNKNVIRNLLDTSFNGKLYTFLIDRK